jgi:hypothetical protein
MASQIKTPSDIDVSKLEFSPVKVLDNGGKSVNIRYEGRNLMVETPSLKVPYGINIFDKQGPPKFSVDLSLGGEDEATRALQDFMEAFDERMIDAGVENAGKWFKMSNPNRDVIKAFYTPLVKVAKDAQGNPKPYPPTFKLALRKRKDGSFETDFYNAASRDEKGQPTAFDKSTPIEEILPKRSFVTTIVQCTGVWFAGGKFGTTWKAFQARVDSQPEQIRGPAFRSDAPDVRAFVAKGLPAKVAPAAAAEPEDDDAEDEDEEEVVAAVLPKKTVAAPAAPPPAPLRAAASVAPAAFEDEAVVEPVPVPAKKKVTVKPKAK